MWKLILILAFVPSLAMAQSNSGMSQDMMNMMEQAQKAQACMQNIDTSEFEKIEQEGRKMETKIKSLCTCVKLDEAQKQAIAYSREMMSRPAMEQMRECSEMLRGMIPKMPFDNFEEEFENKHICDEIK